jgi:hypothetical protein
MLRKLKYLVPIIEWQFNIRVWHFSFQKYEDRDFGIYDNILCIGPFQFKWYTSAIKVGD